MFLKSLELQGFKSFPDKIQLSFDKGLTAVVGPNGSGKSNIGDSVRWVLGEQSTKTLRGNKMEDVIFAGTVARKAVGFAAVTLTIDNTDGTLRDHGDTVSITRKLYRSGESEYQINGKNVRLKDINELFMDTGLGRDGYSIIGQGRIAEIVGAKSNERRDIFEEAAGISKFRYRKQEAERRLADADENLVRLGDIVSELEQRIGPLKTQAEKAEQFLVLAERRKTVEISVWLHRLDQLREKLSVLEEQALVAQAEYENYQNDIAREEEKVKAGYTALQENAVAVEQEQNKILAIEQSAATQKAEIAVCENNIRHSEEAILDLTARRDQEANAKENAAVRIAEQEKRIQALLSEAEELSTRLEQTEQAIRDEEQAATAAEAELNQARSALESLRVRRSEQGFALAAAETTRAELMQSLDGADSAREEQSATLAQYKIDAEDLRARLQLAEEAETTESNRVTGFRRLLEGKNAKLAESKKSLDSAMQALRDKEQRKRIIEDLEKSMEGFGRSVKEVLRAGKSGQIRGICGSVVQLIDVSPEYGVAIETALGAAMQNIVVENEDIAKRGIRFLKENRIGRATFLPLTAVKGNLLQEPRLASEEGFIALASELVTYDEAYTGIIRSLLGRIAVVDDIDSAAMIAKKYGYKFRIVTLDGQVIQTGGAFTGGSTTRSGGVITRKHELEELSVAISELRKNQSEAQETTRRLQAETDKLTYDIEAARDALSAATQEKIRVNAELTSLTALISTVEEQLSQHQDQREDLQARCQRQDELITQAKEALTALDQQLADAEQKLAAEEYQQETVRAAFAEQNELLAGLRLRQLSCEKDKDAAEHELALIRTASEESEDRAVQIAAQIRAEEEKIAACRTQITRAQETLTDSSDEVAACRAEIQRLQKAHNDQQQYITQLRAGINEINAAKEKQSVAVMRAQERKQNVQKDYDSIIMQLLDSYELTRTEAEQFAEEITDADAANAELASLKSKIKALGHVYVNAIDEYREVSERYEFLSGQVSDVLTAKRELEKLIEELTGDMCRIFSENFVIINENFRQIFEELFGGGTAELVLTDPENVLESGIEIKVAPPGKVIKNLISLSGGEQSFVAICIYFAILKLRPAPFCILDEIDAALDEVNVRKYAQYLHRFTSQTQFVLVTHRRSAMEEANVLYGVTMQEDGISRLLKLDQSDIADQMDETAPAAEGGEHDGTVQ